MTKNSDNKQLSIGKKLELLLKKREISVIEFARMVEKTRNQVYSYIEAENINTKFLREWSKILEVPMSYWFSENWESSVTKEKENESLKKENDLLRENQKSKDEIISFYKEKIEMLEKQLSERKEN